MSEPAPSWLTNSCSLWEEDDALTPGRERIRAAWRRLFDEDLDSLPIVDTYDGGDIIYFLHDNGRISVNSYEGGKIRVPVTA